MADSDLARTLPMLAVGASEAAYERVAVALRRALTLRVFADQRLPPERQLAEWFGVSRITIRQALALLRAEGLAAPADSRRAGTLSVPVRAQTDAAYQQLLSDARSDIVDILDYRIIIEQAATRTAAIDPTAHLVGRLRASTEANERAVDPSEFRRSDTGFHVAIAEAARNRHLMGAILVARAEFLRWRDLLPMPDNVAENVLDHQRITELVRTGASDEAADAMAEHLRGTLHVFLVNVAEPSLGVSATTA